MVLLDSSEHYKIYLLSEEEYLIYKFAKKVNSDDAVYVFDKQLKLLTKDILIIKREVEDNFFDITSDTILQYFDHVRSTLDFIAWTRRIKINKLCQIKQY